MIPHSLALSTPLPFSLCAGPQMVERDGYVWCPPSRDTRPRRKGRSRPSGLLNAQLVVRLGGALAALALPLVGGFVPHCAREDGAMLSRSRVSSARHPVLPPAQRAEQRQQCALFRQRCGILATEEGHDEPAAPSKPAPPVAFIRKGTPLEIWHSGRLAFASFEGPNPGKASIRVQLAFDGDAAISLDVGQVTGVWEGYQVSSWEAVQAEAGSILKEMTSKALDLDQFWSQATKLWKRGKTPATSEHLAAYLFHPRQFSKSPDRIGDLLITPAQRYAAAVLLASETFRFKRSVTARASAVDEEPLRVTSFGYRPLDASVVHSREVLSFVNALRRTEEARRLVHGGAAEAQPGGSQLFWDAVHWRMLHHLEVLALGAGVEGLSSDAQNVLKLLGEEASPEGARRVLVRAGYWTGKETQAVQAEEGAKRKSDRAVAEPWPQEVLEVAKEALVTSQRRGEAMKDAVSTGSREDYRDLQFGVYCVDPSGSEFADDALSFDPSTGELLVHITDVQGLLSDFPELEKIAWQRGEAFYLPDGPLHLLPPAALRAASLSDQLPNECVTVAVRLTPGGAVESCRIFQSIIPPITRVLYEDVNELMAQEQDAIPPYQQRMAKELRLLLELATRRRSHTRRQFSEAKALARVTRDNEGNLVGRVFQRTPAHLMIDEFLALYSEACRHYCEVNGVALPMAAGSAAAAVKMDSVRFGTGPLRRYADVLAQRQVSAIIADRPPLTKAEVRERMVWVNKQRLASQKLRSSSRQRVLLETFATFCSTKARTSKADRAVVRAVATGSGTEVMIPDAGGLLSYVRVAQGPIHLAEGEEVEVEVIRVDPIKKEVELVFAEAPVPPPSSSGRKKKKSGGASRRGSGQGFAS